MVAYAYSPNYLRGWGGRISWAQEVEADVSCDCTTALQSAQQRKTLSQTKRRRWKKKEEEEEEEEEEGQQIESTTNTVDMNPTIPVITLNHQWSKYTN